MRILIDTDGTFEGTHVKFDDYVPDLLDFHFSIQQLGKPKAQYKTVDEHGRTIFVSMYGEDFKKFGEPCRSKTFIGSNFKENLK